MGVCSSSRCAPSVGCQTAGGAGGHPSVGCETCWWSRCVPSVGCETAGGAGAHQVWGVKLGLPSAPSCARPLSTPRHPHFDRQRRRKGAQHLPYSVVMRAEATPLSTSPPPTHAPPTFSTPPTPPTHPRRTSCSRPRRCCGARCSGWTRRRTPLRAQQQPSVHMCWGWLSSAGGRRRRRCRCCCARALRPAGTLVAAALRSSRSAAATAPRERVPVEGGGMWGMWGR
eukprot:295408-Chlamydomonas_euryale.AAC.4